MNPNDDNSSKRYIRSVAELVRKNFRFFLWTTLAALALRLAFFFFFPSVTTDSFVYGDIAKNWLQHGIYGLSGSEGTIPTYIRLPGYPAFLALVFTIFGMEHYHAALLIQIVFDLGTCFLIADLTRRLVSPRAAKIAFLLAALCPFLANCASAALTETLEIFFTTLAFDLAIIGLFSLDAGSTKPWLGCGLAVTGATLLRPDGMMLLGCLGIYLAWILFQRFRARARTSPVILGGVVVLLAVILPLIPWTVRNWRAFNRFQPLAPRYANDANEITPEGFHRWVKTWIVDYASVEEIYWKVPDDKADPDNLPSRAFDSAEQRQQTRQLFDDYNDVEDVTPELDARFAALAEQRIHDAPLRYYLWLPAARVVDMWLRPRTEMLPASTRWWEFDDDLKYLAMSVGLGLVGIFYVGAAVVGLWRVKFTGPLGLLLLFLILRSLFLGTLENPEPRYTLECYPIVILLAAACFSGKSRPESER